MNLARVNTDVVQMLAVRLNRTPRAIHYRIKTMKDKLGFGFSDNIALMVMAGEEGIDVYPYLKPEERSEYREALRLRPREIQRVVDSEPTEIIRVVKEPNMPDIRCPNLPERVYKDAENMTDVYYYLYLFENSIRYFIIDTLNKYGDNWWEKKVSKAVKRNAQKNIEQEEKQKWHGKRGQHPIFYTFLSDLSSIISVNWDDFKEKLPSQEWFNQRIQEIELSRNTIAHFNSLENRDFELLKMYFYNWMRQISS